MRARYKDRLEKSTNGVSMITPLQLEIVPERVLVLFQPEQHRFGPISEHFLFRHQTMQKAFLLDYLAYNITNLQTSDITVSSV